MLASPDVDLELLGQSGFYTKVVDLLHDPEHQPAMLGLIIVIAVKADVPIFRENAAKISGLLASEHLRERAFLVLAALARFGPEGIDTEALLATAAELKNGPPGPARRAALDLFPKEASEEEERAGGYDDEEEDEEKTADEEEEKTTDTSGDDEEKTAGDDEEGAAEDEEEKTADEDEEKTAEEEEMATTEPGEESSEERMESDSGSRQPEDEETQVGDEDSASTKESEGATGG